MTRNLLTRLPALSGYSSAQAVLNSVARPHSRQRIVTRRGPPCFGRHRSGAPQIAQVTRSP